MQRQTPACGLAGRLAESPDAKQPTLITPRELSEILGERSRREPIFHGPKLGTTRIDFEKNHSRRFLGGGSLGPGILTLCHPRSAGKALATPHSDVWETSGFHGRKLAPDVYLLDCCKTRAANPPLRDLRAASEGWKTVYHLGTIAQQVRRSPHQAGKCLQHARAVLKELGKEEKAGECTFRLSASGNPLSKKTGRSYNLSKRRLNHPGLPRGH